MVSATTFTLETPIGWIAVGVQDDFVLSIEMDVTPEAILDQPPSKNTSKSSSESTSNNTSKPADALHFVETVKQQLQAYFSGQSTHIEIPYLPRGTPFQQRVWREMSSIPYGQTITYSELAERVRSGPRAVANACGANPLPLLIPCHRVVAKHGLGGFMQGNPKGLSIKQWLLQHERSRS